MPIPTTQDELLKAIDKNFSVLIKDLESVPLDKVFETTLEGHAKGTMMSVHNLVSYLLGWNELVLKWIEKDKKEENIDFPESGFKWNQLGDLAQKFYSDYETVPFDQLLIDFQQAKQKIVEFLAGETNEHLYGNTWYEKYTMGRMIQFNTSSPYANARTRLRKWKKLNQIK
ncbi:ClbS/DfsB family four-helix bundle protein [Vibrio parahaemolyticus]|uniref:ClbS/DfsB family four-helix bundle protein n=1 Tax=Vibrio TaxID=662 RepID=UPI000C7BD21B|nr:ClbS/DfsB family four-helix bundle protein [Vibrio harveyi]AWA98046.1 DfsB family protein [Vibrio harveyi]EGQ8545497.1 ClbS/DfsB family four-helix bundle protein [Vibrio parahaemolyticus]ELC3210011.1 ClbS/DfsB family four-helix bundle protein [Vibrio parahaemolyticus]